jgi:probable HAF family extracellular repeat protein
MRLPTRSFLAGLAASLLSCYTAHAERPQYQIQDLGVVQSGDSASEAFGISISGAIVGRSIRTGGSQAFIWRNTTAMVGLPNLSGRSYCVAKAVLDDGTVVGSCATAASGSDRVPVIWRDGVVSQLALSPVQTSGEANAITRPASIVGSVNAGNQERAAQFGSAGSSVLTGTTPNGSYFVSALGINDSPLLVGRGADPANPARDVAIVYYLQSGVASEIPPLAGKNGGIAYALSASGWIVGASTVDRASPLPFISLPAGQPRAIPLPSGTTAGTARAVNTSSSAVGTASGGTAVPFLYDGAVTYRLIDLIPSGSGWDLSSAVGISEAEVIAGTGVHNGAVRAFAMIGPKGIPPICAMCHKGFRTIYIPCESPERGRHLAHGDTLDSCVPL